MSIPTSLSRDPLSVAIVGGGIAGLTVAIALLTHAPTLAITLYESASAFGEIGAGVGFEPVMVRTMQLIDSRIVAAFERCSKGNTPTEPPIWMRMRVGDRRKVINSEQGETLMHTAGRGPAPLEEEIFHISSRGEGPRGGVHRAHFLDELVKLLPNGITQFRKKLVKISEADDGSGDPVLYFADGTKAIHNAVLGCDEIKSKTRSAVLGDSEATEAVFSGKYAYRGLMPMTKAVEIMGPVVSKTPQMYLGYQGHLLTYPIANGTVMNVVAFSSRPDWTEKEWVLQTTQDDIREDYKHWGPAVRSIVDSLQEPTVWALFNHPPALTYYCAQPLICLVGDAANASTPHQGAGAGMCIEDAYILSQLLSECHSKDEITKAFAAYDMVRRPRTQKLVETSREAGMLWEFQGEGIGDDLEALSENAQNRMAWIWDYDIGVDLARARNAMAG